jgi:hypothetical protein
MKRKTCYRRNGGTGTVRNGNSSVAQMVIKAVRTAVVMVLLAGVLAGERDAHAVVFGQYSGWGDSGGGGGRYVIVKEVGVPAARAAWVTVAKRLRRTIVLGKSGR